MRKELEQTYRSEAEASPTAAEPSAVSHPTPPRPDPQKIEPGKFIYPLTSLLDPLDLPHIFPKPQPVEIELGAGDGGFLIEYARRHPERNFLGVERLLGRLRKIDKKAQRAGLTNVLALRLEASYLVRYLLPPNSVAAFHIYFPDPWPKKKHQKRRLVKPEFAQWAYRALEPGGFVYLRTDSESYFEQMRESFGGHPGFQEVETPPELASILTDFERDFVAEGRTIFRIAYQKRPEPTTSSP